MKTISKQAVRGKAVGTVLASLRMEKLTPGNDVVQGMHAVVNGTETSANVRKKVMRHHVTVRRV